MPTVDSIQTDQELLVTVSTVIGSYVLPCKLTVFLETLQGMTNISFPAFRLSLVEVTMVRSILFAGVFTGIDLTTL